MRLFVILCTFCVGTAAGLLTSCSSFVVMRTNQSRCIDSNHVVNCITFIPSGSRWVYTALMPEHMQIIISAQVNEVNGGETVFVRCVSVCLCAQRTGQSDQFKTVKATDFKSDMRVSTDNPDMTP